MDFFRRHDKKGYGFLTRKQFVDGMMSSGGLLFFWVGYIYGGLVTFMVGWLQLWWVGYIYGGGVTLMVGWSQFWGLDGLQLWCVGYGFSCLPKGFETTRRELDTVFDSYENNGELHYMPFIDSLKGVCGEGWRNSE